MPSGQFWLVSREDEIDDRLRHFADHLRRNWAGPVYWQHKPYEQSRTLDQNALLHVWCTDYACHLLQKDKVSKTEAEAMKYTLIRHCYAETAWNFLVREKRDLFTGKVQMDRASTTTFGKGQMHQFLNWVQARAANDGLVLEAKGEYLRLLKQSNA